MRHVVLAGLGHTHALVLRDLAQLPWPAARVTCVTPWEASMYSGMLPGVLAGQYPRAAMALDASALCDLAGASLRIGAVDGIDHAASTVRLADGSSLPFDVLSLNIGSTSAALPAQAHTPVVPVRPLQTFLDRLSSVWAEVTAQSSRRSWRVTVVGAGLGGIELACTVPAYLVRHSPAGTHVDVRIVTRGTSLGHGLTARTTSRVLASLTRRGIHVQFNAAVSAAAPGDADVLIWAGGAAAPPVLQRLGLRVDDGGYAVVDATLAASATPPIFVAGDAAGAGDTDGTRIPRAGVYAVRQAPILATNIRAVLEGHAMQPFVPQADFLKLINTGDGRAIGQWRGWSFEGRWAWWLKDAIDRRFMRQFPSSAASPATPQPQSPR